MTTVEDILLQKGSDVISTTTTTTIREAARKMVEANVGCILVEEAGEIVGIFTERDLLRRVIDEDRDPQTTLIREVMSSPVKACHPGDDFQECARTLAINSFRHLAVMENDEAVGVISLRDLALLSCCVE